MSARRGVTITTELVNADPPTTCDPAILAALEASAIAAGKTYKKMVARAYHDSSFVSLHCARGHAVHSLPRRREPPARRIRFAGVDRQRRARAGADTGAAGRSSCTRFAILAAPLYAMPQPVRRFRLPQP